MSDKEKLAAIIYDHVWDDTFPTDEADCCAEAILNSDWFNDKLEEVWQAGYSRAVEEERKNQLVYRNRTPQDGW